MNQQLLELFDDEEHSMHALDLSSPARADQSRRHSRGLQSLIHEDVWQAAQQQLNGSLVSARYELELAKKSLELSGGDEGVGGLGW
eukprot:CAMPEP_0197834660 /NCGR_PEP_ID=MMETSP1437-20131217/23224_1 /TAXON_ID=49252 ORGANISM="Eucampia antarctica, Strain CCMP1452" /NCGR_SAMPLE_ID=MMETSP1437 /ASSEMBLY_ACC=CAM_ASM_001096 /LENGTH=85 /DNA_ID=CAMNT_0043439529 /DNA_START=487 /DNA_END=741 /DNA_ORIENTATION=+